MSYAELSILVLGGLFALALIPRAHLGFAAFPAAFIVGSIAGVPVADLVSFFPSSFFILIVGVMSLFAVFQATGAMDWILDWATRLVRGQILLIIAIPFVIGAILSSIGTLPVAAVAIASPITMGLAKQHKIPVFLMGFAALNGVLSGLFSPVAVFGLTSNQLLSDLGVDMPTASNLYIWLIFLAVGVVTQTVVTFFYRNTVRELAKTRLVTSGSHGGVAADDDADTVDEKPLMPRLAALIALCLLIIGGVGFDIDLGFLGFTLAFALLLILRIEPNEVISRIPWGVVILIGGLLTYLGLMDSLDAFTRLSEILTVGDSPLLGLLVLCYIAGITSFLANSVAVIVTTLPLLPPLIAAGVNPLGAVVAVLLSAILVDVNPLGSSGGLIMGATAPEERQRLFRQMLTYGLCAIVVAPLVVWLIFGLW